MTSQHENLLDLTAKMDKIEKMSHAELGEYIAKQREEKAAREAAREAARVKAQAERDAKKQPVRNGVRLPKKGTGGRNIWDLAEKLSLGLGSTIPVTALVKVAVEAGYKEITVRAEHSRWKRFRGKCENSRCKGLR
jgi:hypothetical protein